MRRTPTQLNVRSYEVAEQCSGSTSTRLPALDGLRGIAALVVVLHHVLLVAPGLAQEYGSSDGAERVAGEPWWLAQTPLHLLWAGPEAVYAFFVLSGCVLVMPFTTGRTPVRAWSTWLGYYPQRLLRLYVPVVAASLLSAALVLVFPRGERGALSWWYAAHDVDLSPGEVVKMAVLLRGSSLLNTPFWSLKWEVLFSLLLPVYVLAAAVAVRFGRLATVLVLVGVAAGAASVVPHAKALFFLGMFATGAVLAVHRDRVSAWTAGRSTSFWSVYAVVTAACFEPAWLWPDVAALRGLSFAGAALVVIAFMGCPAALRWGSSRVAQWLGRISFSLYLLHEPIVVSVASVTDTGSITTDVVVVLLVGMPVSLLAAAVFFRGCEAPAHRLSRAVGRCVVSTVRRPPQGLPAQAPGRPSAR